MLKRILNSARRNKVRAKAIIVEWDEPAKENRALRADGVPQAEGKIHDVVTLDFDRQERRRNKLVNKAGTGRRARVRRSVEDNPIIEAAGRYLHIESLKLAPSEKIHH